MVSFESSSVNVNWEEGISTVNLAQREKDRRRREVKDDPCDKKELLVHMSGKCFTLLGGTWRLKVFLEFIWVPQTWPSWTAITRTQGPAAAWESAIVVIYVWIRVLFSSPLLTPPRPPPKRALFCFPPICAVAKLAIKLFFSISWWSKVGKHP